MPTREEKRSPLSAAAEELKNAYKKEAKTYGKKGAAMDILNRGLVTDYLGGAVDVANIPFQGLDWLASKIPALSEPASVMDVDGERVASFPISTDKPYGGKEAWNDAFKKLGVTSNVERPIAELASSLALPLAPSALKKSAALAKAAAPYAARHAVNVAEKYGVSPLMNIVKPEGNLNFRHSVIAESLKGPEKQKVSDFVKQVKGMQGLTKEGKKSAMAALEGMDQNTVVTKQFIEDSFTPSKYSNIDLGGAAEDAAMHMEIAATERALDDPDRWHTVAAHLDLDYEDSNIADQLERLYSKIEQDTRERRVMLDPERYLKDLSPEVIEAMKRSGFIDQGVFEIKRFNATVDEVTTDLADTYLEMMQENHSPIKGYQHEEFQRLNPDIRVGDYVEKGVSHPDAPKLYGHYPGAPSPLVAHFRGTGNAEEVYLPTRYKDNVDLYKHELKPNSFVIEELQSDAQKGIKQEGPLHQAHATAFKAAVQHALEQGHTTVYLPSADAIAHIRPGKEAANFAPIYDQEVVNFGLSPLSKMEGVDVVPIMSPEAGRGVAYHELNFSPEAIEELLSGKGQAFPGFAGGGAVDMKEGGSVSNLRSHYLGTPMTKVSAESMSPDLFDILEEWGANQDLKSETQEQIENLSPLDYEAFRLAQRLDKHDRYKTGKFPSGQDNAINSPSPFEQPIEDMPGDFKFNNSSTGLGDRIRSDPYRPNEMDSMTKDWDGMSTQRQEKIKQRYYADGGTVNLRAHYLGY